MIMGEEPLMVMVGLMPILMAVTTVNIFMVEPT